MAFECQHCGFRNSEVQMGGVIPDKGVHFELRVEKGDMKACGGWRKLNLVRSHAPPSRSRAKLSRATRAPAGCGHLACILGGATGAHAALVCRFPSST